MFVYILIIFLLSFPKVQVDLSISYIFITIAVPSSPVPGVPGASARRVPARGRLHHRSPVPNRVFRLQTDSSLRAPGPSLPAALRQEAVPCGRPVSKGAGCDVSEHPLSLGIRSGRPLVSSEPP